MRAGWLNGSELRIGLGCMRLMDDEPIVAAAEAGVTVFDTARAYGDNEALVARTLRACGAAERARIVTKGGMARHAAEWAPDGRAKTIRSDCEASLAALDGLAIDLYLVHAPDPRTPWRTSLRALGRLLDDGLVRHVGVANINRRQLDEALANVPLTAVQVALSLGDDRALRGGIVERCAEAGVAVIAHSPLGGPRGVGRLLRGEILVATAERRGAEPAEVALAWLLQLSPAVVAIPGARRVETARSAARAASLSLDPADVAALRPAVAPRRRRAGEVVLVMGIPGAGKSRVAEEYVARGFLRLNRDERGGSLRGLADALGEELSAGARLVVLDNTYLTRAERSYVIEAAARHGVAARCVWVDAPLAQAQVNVVERLLDRFGVLPAPEQLRAAARNEPGLLLPTSQMRTLRRLEPPAEDEGFASVEHVPFARERSTGTVGVFVAAPVLGTAGWRGAIAAADPAAPHLLFDWRPGADDSALDDAAARLSTEVSGAVEYAVCPHPGGPPSCWCRPPLPGLPLAFARRRGVSTSRSVLLGTSPAHRTLAAALEARYVPA